VAGLWAKAAGSVAGYARRAAEFAFRDAPDLAVIHREAVPRGNAWVIDRLRRRKVPMVYDIDDAIYLAPRDFVSAGEDSREAMTRGKDPSEVLALMAAADVVLAGNATLAARAREAGARRVVVLPTPVDTDLFVPGGQVGTGEYEARGQVETGGHEARGQVGTGGYRGRGGGADTDPANASPPRGGDLTSPRSRTASPSTARSGLRGPASAEDAGSATGAPPAGAQAPSRPDLAAGAQASSRPDLPLVGWIGSPTATYCLRAIAPALAAAARAVPFRLLVVGASGRVEVPGVEVIHRDWSLDREASDYASLDVGLYPLPDNPWTRGKCGYKALLYQSCAVPCLASPVGVNAEIVADGVTGYHAADDAAWTDRLVALLRDPALRARMGAAGRRAVEERWSLRVLAPRMVAALREAAAR